MAIGGIGKNSFGLNELNKASKELGSLFAKLASGTESRLKNSAGFAIADSQQNQANLYKVASNNTGYAQSAIAIADGAASQLSGITDRLQELAIQSANGTLSDDQRATLNQEYTQLTEEMSRITSSTEFNGTQLLQGSSVSVQTGIDGSSGSTTTVSGNNFATLVQSLQGTSIASLGDAANAINSVSNAAQQISSQRGELGASSSRLETVEKVQSSSREQLITSASKITDFDYAQGTADLLRTQIKQQAGVALLAQANVSAGNALRLLS